MTPSAPHSAPPRPTSTSWPSWTARSRASAWPPTPTPGSPWRPWRRPGGTCRRSSRCPARCSLHFCPGCRPVTSAQRNTFQLEGDGTRQWKPLCQKLPGVSPAARPLPVSVTSTAHLARVPEGSYAARTPSSPNVSQTPSRCARVNIKSSLSP